MSTLPTPLRKLLEGTITEAREIAERGARKALQALAVHEADPYPHMSDAQRELRRKLQAQARQLGDRESLTRPGTYETKHLAEKLAYDQWHRLLFARYLVENNLLISPGHGVAVTLHDCEELAPSLGLKDAWAVAAHFAAKELPEIFRADDPAGEVELPVEDRHPLIQLVTALPIEVFTASDSLGWCYQFWQAKRKDEVNASGNKIGADELPAVTQLFTEDYMVDFLLDNTLGAWHAGKVLAANPELAGRAESEDELRNAVSLPACPWKYLRFIRSDDGKWSPAAGTFDGWSKAAKDLKCLDPCMGSGHFIVAMFERLVSLRIAEEAIDDEEAAAAVVRDNLFGLEIDPRCAQIAAFNLALTAWRRVGHHFTLPPMNLACSGLAPNATLEDWSRLAGNNSRLQEGMARLHALFKDSPVLGSLLDPHMSAGSMFVAEFNELQPLLETALARESCDDRTHEMAVTARGLAKVAELLVEEFTLIGTNVPYLGSGDFSLVLKQHIDSHFSAGKADLATAFLLRFVQSPQRVSTLAVVSPQSWWFLGSSVKLRRALLSRLDWKLVATLGEEAWRTFGKRGPKATLVIAGQPQTARPMFFGIDALPLPTVDEKSRSLREDQLLPMSRRAQLNNPDHRITIGSAVTGRLLSHHAYSFKGITTGDDPRFRQRFWEQSRIHRWRFLQSTVSEPSAFGGCESILDLERMTNPRQPGVYVRAEETWGRHGVAVTQMRTLASSLSLGEAFDTNVAVIMPNDQAILAAIWLYCSSPEFPAHVRRVDQKVGVTSATLVKVPFDVERWQSLAAEKFPDGLPKPFSSNPTQWLFDGHPKNSDQPLHVGLARLLGYYWPRQTGSSFPDCPALAPDGLETRADGDGIVCLSATKGEAPAAERLRALLAKAFGEFDLKSLLAGAGPKGSKSETLEEWLRDEFFEQHCALFHHRPFIWHVWDGHKSGFSALVNYHKLDHGNLEKLTYSYLGDWIRRQQAAVDAGEAGSDARLEAAKRLQARLKLILEGEPPFDLFVRWKPLPQQAIGWHPDLNDGVRMNIRPFLAQDIPGGKKGAGILRSKPGIKWGPKADRGKEPVRDKKEFPWFWGWDGETIDFKGVGTTPDGNRWNDLHYTNAVKLAARASKQ